MKGSEAPPPTQPFWKTLLDYVVAGAIVVALLGAIVFGTYACQSAAIGAAGSFFQQLREGRVDQAYRSLAEERRRRLTYEQFRQLVVRPGIQGSTDAAFGNTPQWGPVDGLMHACTAGELLHGEQDAWYVEVYLTKRPDEPWRVHEWALQPPSPISRTMLDRCRTAW